jgi:ribonuclease J
VSSAQEFQRDSTLEIIPMGGVGEFGMNMMAVSFSDTTVVIDAGAMFPGPEHFGVARIIPDISCFDHVKRKPSALVLTHGHEDHIGAIPYLWDLIDCPVYGTQLTLALLESRLTEHGIDKADRLVTITAGQRVAIGKMDVEFISVTHSLPGCVALAVHTPVGTIVHTGDFKIDQTPIDNSLFDASRLTQLGDDGVLVLLADSTNIARPGHTDSERAVTPTFENIFNTAKGKLVVTTFSSSLHRLQVLVDLAVQFDRKVCFVGRGMQRIATIAQRLGHLVLPLGCQISDKAVHNYSPSQILCIATGSQGEPFAALSRIAMDSHPHIKLEDEDVVVFSARPIPGNQSAIGRVMNNLYRRGAEVIDGEIGTVHVSGHGSEEDLKFMLSMVRPRYFVPIHGEYRYLAQHARMARRIMNDTATVLLVENGTRLRFGDTGTCVRDSVPAGSVFIDGSHVGSIGQDILSDRRHLASHGIVVVSVLLDLKAGTIENQPTVTTRGFAGNEKTNSILRTVPGLVRELIDGIKINQHTDSMFLQEYLRTEVERLLRKRSGQRPIVLPIILES